MDMYDVFVSFRGEDAHENFTSFLHASLNRGKIKSYIDIGSRRDEISGPFLQFIGQTKMSLIIFTKGYASSSWCLDELVHILRCRETNRQIVVPVFYDMNPSHIRQQTGSYGAAFFKHETRVKNHKKVQAWRAALNVAAGLCGWDTRNSW